MLLNQKAQVHHSCVVNTPLADVPLVDLLWRVRTIALPVPGLIAVAARTVGRWSLGIGGTRVAPRKSNRVTLAETRLCLILLHRRAILLVRSWSRYGGLATTRALDCDAPASASKALLRVLVAVYTVL